MFPHSLFWCVALLFLTLCGASVRANDLPSLTLSENRRYLVQADGRPFFYLGDTAWELIHRLKREEAEIYLNDRAAKGFNVVQTVILAEFHGLTEPNAYGHLPLVGADPRRPVEAYFEHVDFVVARAAARGMYTALLPTWGDKVNKRWGHGPEIFTPENARIFGEYIGNRYRQSSVIWVLGGDRPIESEQHRLIYRALAEGLRQTAAKQLMTYHPSGRRSSSQDVHNESWLDFHMMQSGHQGRDHPVGKMIARDYGLIPVRPVLDGEPNYEDHPVRGAKDGSWFDEWDARKQAYRSVFAGGCGVTYGAHSIWQFWDGKSKPCADPRRSWQDALGLPGAAQYGYLKRLMLSRPFLTRVPDQSLIASGEGEGAGHLQATRDAKGSYAMIHTPDGQPCRVDLSKLTGKKLRAWWWDPRTGHALAGEEIANEGVKEFKAPRSGPSFDWVLVLDDAAENFTPPGTVAK